MCKSLAMTDTKKNYRNFKYLFFLLLLLLLFLSFFFFIFEDLVWKEENNGDKQTLQLFAASPFKQW